jgi:CrcB protein
VVCAAGPILDFELLASMLLVAGGTALGSVVRDRSVQLFRRRTDRADLGVLAVNLAACVVAGLAGRTGPLIHVALVVGFAGGLSTWSSLAVEVAGELRARRWSRIALHIPGAFAIALVAYHASRALAGADA